MRAGRRVPNAVPVSRESFRGLSWSSTVPIPRISSPRQRRSGSISIVLGEPVQNGNHRARTAPANISRSGGSRFTDLDQTSQRLGGPITSLCGRLEASVVMSRVGQANCSDPYAGTAEPQWICLCQMTSVAPSSIDRT